MTIAGRVLLGITERLRRSRRQEIFQEIREEPYKSRSQISADQFGRLSSLLASAEAHVPYYREIFRTLGIRSRDIRSLQDFASLPILTKDIVRERQNELIREDVDKEKLRISTTGGSTGIPLRFYRDDYASDAGEAGTFRALGQSGWKPGEMIAYFWGGNAELYAMSRLEFELRQYLRRMYQLDPFHSGPEEMDRWLAKWKRIGPSVAFGYATAVANFARHIASTGRRVNPLRGVFTTAEKLYPPQREIISKVFGCRVYDCYGSSEICNIATECSHGRMHINSDFVVLEADRTGIAPGEPVPFVITSLWARVMPFIRYRNEDCGEFLEGDCDCGNHFPLLQLNIARIYDSFTFPDGQVVHGHFFTRLMELTDGIATFQFHQTALDSIIMWIVPGPGDSSLRQRSIRSVVEHIEKIDTPRQIKVEVRETEKIPLSPAGKHRFTISDVRVPRGVSPTSSVITTPNSLSGEKRASVSPESKEQFVS